MRFSRRYSRKVIELLMIIPGYIVMLPIMFFSIFKYGKNAILFVIAFVGGVVVSLILHYGLKKIEKKKNVYYKNSILCDKLYHKFKRATPEKFIKLTNLKEGSKVLQIGFNSPCYLIELIKTIGEKGKLTLVYFDTTDLEFIEYIQRKYKYPNIELVHIDDGILYQSDYDIGFISLHEKEVGLFEYWYEKKFTKDIDEANKIVYVNLEKSIGKCYEGIDYSGKIYVMGRENKILKVSKVYEDIFQYLGRGSRKCKKNDVFWIEEV